MCMCAYVCVRACVYAGGGDEHGMQRQVSGPQCPCAGYCDRGARGEGGGGGGMVEMWVHELVPFWGCSTPEPPQTLWVCACVRG